MEIFRGRDEQRRRGRGGGEEEEEDRRDEGELSSEALPPFCFASMRLDLWRSRESRRPLRAHTEDANEPNQVSKEESSRW